MSPNDALWSKFINYKKHPNKATMTTTSPWVVASSALFFVPALLAFLRQSVVVAIVYINAALFSTLYHANAEQKYEELDVFWANVAVLLSLVMLAVISIRYAPWNWRVLLPSLFGITGMALYFVGGQDETPSVTQHDPHYEVYHSLWHLFMSMAATVLVWTPVNFAEAHQSYGEVYLNLYKNYAHPHQTLLSV